jgi:hypothetical protein
MSETPSERALAAAVERVRQDLRREMAESLRRGGVALVDQVNSVVARHDARISKLERVASRSAISPSSKRR